MSFSLKMILYLGIVFSCFIASVIPQNNNVSAYFLPYGSSPEFEDTELLPTADDFSRIEDLTNPFHFGSMSFPRFEVTANGMVFLRKAGDASSQRNPVLGVFAGDVNNLLLGNIYFRKSEQGTDATTCAQAEQAILEATPEFIGRSLLTIVVVTWEDVPENKCFATSSCEKNTFQLLIGTDGESTYVIFNYGTISWTRKASAGIGYLEPTESRELFAPFNPSSSHILWRVTDGDVPNDLLSNSNYGVPGSYLFEVSNTIREIGKVVCRSTNPCLNGGSCMDNECFCVGGFYGRFCHLSDSTGEDSCAAHPCLNGGNCEDGSCLCPAAFSGNRCQDKLTSVECGSGSMTVIIDKRLVPGNANAVHFINQSCFGVESSNSDEITLSTNYRECGTTLTDDVSTMTFSNVITYEKPEAEGDTAITREYQMQLRVECCLNKSETVDGSFKPRLGKVAFSDKSTGNFDLNLARFKTENIQEVDSSSVSLGQELFFEVSLKSVEILGMFIESCWATATVDPATNPHHSLISSRCPEDPTTSINNDLDLDRESFSFQAFAFTGDNQNTQVYVHCLVMVCGAEEAGLNRDMGCPSNDGEAAFWNSSPVRKRRSTSSLSTQTISSGPIRIRNPTSGMATNDVSLYNPFAMLILGISAAVVAMLILMGVVKLVGTNFNYHRVSTETI